MEGINKGVQVACHHILVAFRSTSSFSFADVRHCSLYLRFSGMKCKKVEIGRTTWKGSSVGRDPHLIALSFNFRFSLTAGSFHTTNGQMQPMTHEPSHVAFANQLHAGLVNCHSVLSAICFKTVLLIIIYLEQISLLTIISKMVAHCNHLA